MSGSQSSSGFDLSSLDGLPTETLLGLQTDIQTDIQTEWKASIERNLATYCPHKPWPKQRFVLDLDCREIFFGGAKGPGKTDLLLMAGLRYVHVPGYAALYLRRSTREARQANALLDRLRLWTANTDVKWNLTDSTASWPSGAKFKFGYIDNPQDAFQFMGAEYHQILWDELTDFRLSDSENNPYLFMFGMNRRPEIGCHPMLRMVPLQMIAGSNPGGRSHLWVKRRFVTEEALQAITDPKPRAFYSTPSRCYVPALIQDNPAIDAESYVRDSLSHLPPVTRARYVAGDWSVQEEGLLRADWLRDFDQRGEIIRPLTTSGELLNGLTIDRRTIKRFATIDTAGTEDDKKREKSGKAPSWSVCAVWDYWAKHNFLFLQHVWRARTNWDALKVGIAKTLIDWGVRETIIENAHWGGPLKSELDRAHKFSPRLFSPAGKNKMERSTKFQNMLEKGQVFLPLGENSWRLNLESEWLSWTGDEDETADQIDVASMAAIHVGGGTGATWGGVIKQPVATRIAGRWMG